MVTRKRLISPPEAAVVDSLARLQANILAKAMSDRRNARLVATDHIRATEEASQVQQVTGWEVRQPNPEIPAEVPVLLPEPHEDGLAAGESDEASPIDTANGRAVTGRSRKGPTKHT